MSVCNLNRMNTVDHLDKLFTYTSHKHNVSRLQKMVLWLTIHVRLSKSFRKPNNEMQHLPITEIFKQDTEKNETEWKQASQQLLL